MQAKNLKRLKHTAMGLVIISLLGFIYSTHMAINFFLLLNSGLHSYAVRGNLTLAMVGLKPVLFLALIISAAGLYRLRRWGLYLANSAMAAYLATFALTHFGKNGAQGAADLYHPNPQWPVFLQYSYNWDTLILPASIVILLILLNFSRPFNPNG